MPRAGIEPAWGYPHWILSPARLPVPPPRRGGILQIRGRPREMSRRGRAAKFRGSSAPSSQFVNGGCRIKADAFREDHPIVFLRSVGDRFRRGKLGIGKATSGDPHFWCHHLRKPVHSAATVRAKMVLHGAARIGDSSESLTLTLVFLHLRRLPIRTQAERAARPPLALGAVTNSYRDRFTRDVNFQLAACAHGGSHIISLVISEKPWARPDNLNAFFGISLRRE